MLIRAEVVKLGLCLPEGERNTVLRGGPVQMVAYYCDRDGTEKRRELRQGWVGVPCALSMRKFSFDCFSHPKRKEEG